MDRNYGSDMTSSQKIEEQEKKQLKEARIFQRVFGSRGNRNEDQEFVLETLARWGNYEIPYSAFGQVTTERVMNLEGMRELFLCIKTACDFNFDGDEGKAPEVDTSSQVGK